MCTNETIPDFSLMYSWLEWSNFLTLYINKSVLFSEIKLDTDLQDVAVRVSAKKTLTVCNIYLPPSLEVNFSDLEHLIEQLPAPFVLVGDLNAHSPLWGDVRQDSRGQMVEKLLNDYNLCLLNTGEPTYRRQSSLLFCSWCIYLWSISCTRIWLANP